MEIKIEEAEFKPISLVLNTQEEVNFMYELLKSVNRNVDAAFGVDTFGAMKVLGLHLTDRKFFIAQRGNDCLKNY